jgi:hypothetical protein
MDPNLKRWGRHSVSRRALRAKVLDAVFEKKCRQGRMLRMRLSMSARRVGEYEASTWDSALGERPIATCRTRTRRRWPTGPSCRVQPSLASAAGIRRDGVVTVASTEAGRPTSATHHTGRSQRRPRRHRRHATRAARMGFRLGLDGCRFPNRYRAVAGLTPERQSCPMDRQDTR